MAANSAAPPCDRGVTADSTVDGGNLTLHDLSVNASPRFAVGVAPAEAIVRVARQFPVFPCRRTPEEVTIGGKPRLLKAKTPLVARGFHAATQDVEQIRAWWARWPDALAAVPTGSLTRLVVIDYDTPKSDAAGLEWLEAHTDELMSTRSHETLSGGRHYLFRAPDGIKYRSGVCVELAGARRGGIDIRAEGGYIVWWPLHGGPTSGEIAALPAGLLDERKIEARALPALPTASPAQWKRDRQILLNVLPYLDPTNYDQWIHAGMATHLCSGASDDGFDIWHTWSAGELTGTAPANYSGIEDCRCRWESFNAAGNGGNPIGLGSLIVAAKTAGYSGHATPPDEPQAEESPPIENYGTDEGGFADTDIANAKRFSCQHGENVRFTPERGWFVWDGRRWAVDDKFIAVQELGKHTALAIFDEVKTAARRDEIYRHARKSQGRSAIEAMIHLARSEPGIPARLTDFDADAWLFNVANGTLELRTGKLREHRRTDLISNISEIAYDPEAECELWDAFVWRVTDRNDELYAYLRRLCGYLLVGDVSEQALHFLHGTGSNGKSVFCEVLQRLLGDYATVASPDLVMLKRHGGIPNDVARLRGVRAVFMNETSQGSRFDEAKLKDLTGGDTLTARFLHQEFFDFRPTHRILIRGNHKPSIHGTDDGIWRRLRMLPFAVQIPDDEQDLHLLRKLEAELPGILNWTLAGTADWQRGGLRPPAVVVEAARRYREESDTLGRFIAEQCQARTLAEVRSSSLFRRYQEFAEQAGERWIPARDFPAEMERRGFQHKRGTGGQRLFVGIEFRDSELPWTGSDGK